MIVPAPSAVVTVVSISIFTGSANRRTDLLDAMEYETPRHGCAINCVLDGKARCDLWSHSSPLRVAVPTDDVVGCGKLRETIAVDYTLSSSSLTLLLQQGFMQTPCVRNQGTLCERVIVMDILLSFPQLARKIKTSYLRSMLGGNSCYGKLSEHMSAKFKSLCKEVFAPKVP